MRLFARPMVVSGRSHRVRSTTWSIQGPCGRSPVGAVLQAWGSIHDSSATMDSSNFPASQEGSIRMLTELAKVLLSHPYQPPSFSTEYRTPNPDPYATLRQTNDGSRRKCSCTVATWLAQGPRSRSLVGVVPQAWAVELLGRRGMISQ